jgi:uncharacterized protein
MFRYLCLSFLPLVLLGCSSASTGEVKFKGHQDLELQGKLTTPGGLGAKPAVLLLPGSGPTDRDGNQKPHLTTDLLKSLATSFHEAGFATLRFDKRAAPTYASVWPKDGLEDFFSWQAFVQDAAAALRVLRSTKGVHPDKVFILGHSEGGMIALQLAADLPEKEKPAGLILAGTPGRHMGEILRDQLTNIMTLQGADKKTIDEYLEITRKAVESVEKTAKVPTNIPPGLQPLFPVYAGKLLQGYAKWNPQELGKRFTGPVLVINGENDSQVSATKDAGPLAEALGRKAKLVIVEAASHNFKKAETLKSPGLTGPIEPDAISAMLKWLKEQS